MFSEKTKVDSLIDGNQTTYKIKFWTNSFIDKYSLVSKIIEAFGEQIFYIFNLLVSKNICKIYCPGFSYISCNLRK